MNDAQRPMDLKKVMMAAKDFLLSAGVGWAASAIAAVIYRAEVTEIYVWYDDLLAVIRMSVGVVVGGLLYSAILHSHAKRQQGK